ALAKYTTTDADAMDLNALTQAAIHHYPELRAQQYRIEAAKARLGEARWSPYTQFTAEATLAAGPSVSGTPIFSPDSELPLSNPWKPIFGVEVKGAVPIYTFGKLEGARKAAKAGVHAAEYQQANTITQMLYDLRRAYFGLQLSLDAM